MVEWLKSVISDPGIISAIKVTFTMAVCSTAISSVLGIVLGPVSYTHLCGGDPKCAKFCPTGAISYEDPEEGIDRKRAVADHFKDVFGEEAKA